MRPYVPTFPTRQWSIAGIAAFAVLCVVGASSSGEPKDPLSYVPADAAVFAHARVDDLWETPLVIDVRKDLVARLETSIALKADFPIEKIAVAIVKKINLNDARANTASNFRQIGVAMHNYQAANNILPSAAICDKKGKPLLSWRVSILPFIDQNELYKQFDLDEPWNSDHNKKLIAKMPKIYAAPGDKADGKTNYRVFIGNGAGFELIESFRIPQDFPDGTSNTCMVVEAADAVEWTKPEEIEYDPTKDPRKLVRWVDDATWVAIFDGSARQIKKKMSEQTWHNFIQRNDGNPLGDDF